MDYYLDTEFLEGTQKKRLLRIPCGNTKPTIDLISIGIVSEDDREYYAVSKDFNLKEAWNRFQNEKITYVDNGALEAHIDKIVEREYWIRENVLRPIFEEFIQKEYDLIEKMNRMGVPNSGEVKDKFTYRRFKKLLNKYGKVDNEIAREIVEFTLDPTGEGYDNWLGDLDGYYNALKTSSVEKPVFYAYYADYDFVAFCWLFGKMIDLPKGFPMYCRDLKQILDEYSDNSGESIDMIKSNIKFPKQENEHNALDDAKWNKKLHTFIKSL